MTNRVPGDLHHSGDDGFIEVIVAPGESCVELSLPDESLKYAPLVSALMIPSSDAVSRLLWSCETPSIAVL